MPNRTRIPSGVSRQIAIVRRGLVDFKQEKLATMAGLGLRTLQRIEAGKREPSTAELMRIAEALDVSVLVLFPKEIPVSKYASLNFGGDLFTAEVPEGDQPVPFVVFHAYDYIDTKAFETDDSLRSLWSDSYGIKADSPINIRRATENERAIWGGGAAAYIADLEVEDRPAFLVDNRFFEVGIEDGEDNE